MSWKPTLLRFIGAFLILAVTASTSAQQVPNLSTRAQAIKRKAETLAPHSAISVVPVHGDEQFGEFLSSNQEGFLFYNIDRKMEVTFKYEDVHQLKNGYGGYNSVTGRHTDHTRALVITIVVLGVLGAVIGAAAAAKN